MSRKIEDKSPVCSHAMTTKDLEDDPVHPAHYMSYLKGGVSCIDAMKDGLGTEEAAHYCMGRAFCLLWKHEDSTDIEQAIWYLQKYLELTK